MGRSWFKQARIKQHQGSTKGKKNILLNMAPIVSLPKEARALHTQFINMVSEVIENEKDKFLEANGSPIPIFLY